MSGFLSQISFSLNQNNYHTSLVEQQFPSTTKICQNCKGNKFIKRNGKLMVCTLCKNDVLLSKSLMTREKSGQNQNDNAVDSFCSGAYQEFTKGRNLGQDARKAGETTGKIVRDSIETIGRGVNNSDDGGWSMSEKNVYGK
jgi:hypothetical protein